MLWPSFGGYLAGGGLPLSLLLALAIGTGVVNNQQQQQPFYPPQQSAGNVGNNGGGGGYYPSNYNGGANGNGNNFYPANYNNPYYQNQQNQYGFCYVPYQCLYNFVPPFMLPLLPPTLVNILQSLLPAQLSSLLLPLLQTYSTFPSFLNALQNQAPPLYNAYNQMNGAYNAMDPGMQRILQQCLAAMVPAVQNAIGQFNSLSPTATPQFNQNFPQLANFLRSPGMRAFARDNSFSGSAAGPLMTGNGGIPPAQQQPTNQQQQLPSPGGGLPLGVPAAGGGPNNGQQQPQSAGNPPAGNGLVDGILGAVSSAVNGLAGAGGNN